MTATMVDVDALAAREARDLLHRHEQEGLTLLRLEAEAAELQGRASRDRLEAELLEREVVQWERVHAEDLARLRDREGWPEDTPTERLRPLHGFPPLLASALYRLDGYRSALGSSERRLAAIPKECQRIRERPDFLLCEELGATDPESFAAVLRERAEALLPQVREAGEAKVAAEREKYEIEKERCYPYPHPVDFASLQHSLWCGELAQVREAHGAAVANLLRALLAAAGVGVY